MKSNSFCPLFFRCYLLYGFDIHTRCTCIDTVLVFPKITESCGWIYLYENNSVGPEARHPKDGKAGIHDGNTHLKPKATAFCIGSI